MLRTGTLLERLEDRYTVDPNSGCWLWLGSYDSHGYGQMKVNGRSFLAHRLMYKEAVGELVDGLVICHECNNPACVNPAHLRQDTQKANCEDRERAGNTCRWEGKTPPNKRMTSDELDQILSMRRDGRTLLEISEKTGFSLTHCSRICRAHLGKTSRKK